MVDLRISDAIIKVLKLNKGVTDYTSNRIFRIVAESGIKTTFIAVQRTGIQTSRYSNKDYDETTQNIQIQVVSNNYNDATDCAEAVCNALIDKEYNVNNLNLYGFRVISASEDYLENAYVQRLVFSVEVEKK